MIITAIQNFGYLGANVEKGVVIDVDPAKFGDTWDDFLANSGCAREGAFEFKDGDWKPSGVKASIPAAATVAAEPAAPSDSAGTIEHQPTE